MYAVVDSNQVVIDVIEGGPATAPEGGFIAQTSMYKKGDFYGCAGAPTFAELDGTEPLVVDAPPAPQPEEAPVVVPENPTEDSNG